VMNALIAVNFARQVPHGLLLFFPSYPVMQKCIEQWQVIEAALLPVTFIMSWFVPLTYDDSGCCSYTHFCHQTLSDAFRVHVCILTQLIMITFFQIEVQKVSDWLIINLHNSKICQWFCCSITHLSEMSFVNGHCDHSSASAASGVKHCGICCCLIQF